MKRVVLCLSFVAATSSAAASSTAPAKPTSAHNAPVAHHAVVMKHVAKIRVAPADEYFGKMKMSILGIRNEIKDLGIKADFEPAKSESIFSMASLTEDAMKDWEHKYPQDSWLPKTIFALERMYNKVPTAEGRDRAKRAMQWLVAHYPRTWFAKTGRLELAAGKVGAPLVAAPPTPATTAAIPDAVPPSEAAPAPVPTPASPLVGPGVSNGIVTLPASSIPASRSAR